MTPLDTAKLYFSLSNSRNLDMIEELFDTEATYSSDVTGVYYGREAIMRMMRDFFDRFDYLHWDIDAIEDQADGEVLIQFHAIFQNEKETKERTGIERIQIKDGSILSITIQPL